jgi:hypothetical protein
MNRDALDEAKRLLPLPQLWELLNLTGKPGKSCKCPLHEDGSNSGSVFQRADGTWAFKCFAGCGTFDEPDLLAHVRGLSLGDAIREFKKLAGVAATAPPSSFSPLQASPAKCSDSGPPLDWPQCVRDFTAEHAAKFAAWRALSLAFVLWLHARQFIGLFRGKLAFAVADPQTGAVVRAHVRAMKRHPDGTEEVLWFYSPKGPGLPLVVGDARTASTVWAFESQFDLLAALDLAGWHQTPDGLPGVAAIATRGAENGKRLAGLLSPDATLVLFPQIDAPKPDRLETPAQKWTREAAAHAGCKAVQIVPTPDGFKDLNDALRAGLTPDQFRAALATAQPVPVAVVDLHAPRVRVSKPPIVLPESEDEDDPAPADFPLGCLPPAMAGMIAAVARCERVPLALPALAALGVASASIGAGLEVGSGASRVTRGNLFLLGSAESGSGKSETFRIVAAPLLDHQSRLLETWRKEIAGQLAEQISTPEAQIKRLTREASRKDAKPADVERINGEKAFKRAEITERTSRAAMPCVVAQDVTTERLATILRDNREVTFSASADARKVIQNLLGRYNSLQSTDESLYLSGYSGDFVRVDRQGRDAVVLHRPCLALCWLVQPDLLGTMLGEETLSASGFLPRLLICDTRATPRRIEGEAPTLPEQMRLAWWQLIADLLTTYHAADAHHRITPAPAALACLTEFHNRVVDRRGADLADVGAYAARYAENAWRVAVVLHAALYGAQAHTHPLDAETAANAVRVVEWFAAAQLEILGKARRQAAAKLEDQILALITSNTDRKAQDFTTAREVQRARIAATAETARALLARMETAGLLVGEDVTPPGGGRAVRIFRAACNSPVPG